MKKTKIITTLWPSTDTKDKIEALYKSWANVVRFNYSHTNYDYFSKIIDTVKELNKEWKTNLWILTDTKWPEIRTKSVEEKISLEKDEEFFLSNTLNESKISDNSKKMIICDYDYMEKHGIIFEEFKKMIHEAGYNLVINRPNFEFFVLTLLAGLETAISESPSNYMNAINIAAKGINASNTKKGFSDGMMIPKYSKRCYAIPIFFGKLFDYNRELIDEFCKIRFDDSSKRFSDMSKIINRIKELRNK